MCVAAQGLLGRKHLEHVLQRASLLPQGTALQTAFPAVRRVFPTPLFHCRL